MCRPRPRRSLTLRAIRSGRDASVAGGRLGRRGRPPIEKLNARSDRCCLPGNGIRLARARRNSKSCAPFFGFPPSRRGVRRIWSRATIPRYVGRPGIVAARGANFALQNCDFLLAIGVRLDFAITGYAPQNPAREAYKVAVDIDPAELAKLHPHLQQPIVADAREFLLELLRQEKDQHPARDRLHGRRVAPIGRPGIRS